MTFTRRIPVERLDDLKVREGDTLHIVAVRGSSFVVEVTRSEDQMLPQHGKASEWLQTAKGSVRLQSGESADDLRMAYYAEKYGLAK